MIGAYLGSLVGLAAAINQTIVEGEAPSIDWKEDNRNNYLGSACGLLASYQLFKSCACRRCCSYGPKGF